MNWLKDDIGFEGWRFDFVKGYAPEFMQDYCGKTVGNDAWNVGEYWADLRWVPSRAAVQSPGMSLARIHICTAKQVGL